MFSRWWNRKQGLSEIIFMPCWGIPDSLINHYYVICNNLVLLSIFMYIVDPFFWASHYLVQPSCRWATSVYTLPWKAWFPIPSSILIMCTKIIKDYIRKWRIVMDIKFLHYWYVCFFKCNPALAIHFGGVDNFSFALLQINWFIVIPYIFYR